IRCEAFNAAPDASTANWAFRVWTAISRSRSRITNSSAVTVSGAEGITGARAHPASKTRTAAPTSRPFVGARRAVPLHTRSIHALGEHRIQGLSHFRYADEFHGLDRRHFLQIALRQQTAPEAQLRSLPQASLSLPYRSHFSTQADFTEDNRRRANGTVPQAGGHRRHDAEVQRRLLDLKPSHHVHIDVLTAKVEAHPFLHHRDQERDPVAVHAVRRPPGHGEACR